MAVALVTGANGFIGAHLVKALVERDYHVRCLVRGTSDLTSLHNIPDIELHLGDVRQPDTLVAPVQNVDIIFPLYRPDCSVWCRTPYRRSGKSRIEHT